MVDIDINAAFVSGVCRVDAGDAVVFNEHRAVVGGGGLEGKWALEILPSRCLVELDGVGG